MVPHYFLDTRSKLLLWKNPLDTQKNSKRDVLWKSPCVLSLCPCSLRNTSNKRQKRKSPCMQGVCWVGSPGSVDSQKVCARFAGKFGAFAFCKRTRSSAFLPMFALATSTKCLCKVSQIVPVVVIKGFKQHSTKIMWHARARAAENGGRKLRLTRVPSTSSSCHGRQPIHCLKILSFQKPRGTVNCNWPCNGMFFSNVAHGCQSKFRY